MPVTRKKSNGPPLIPAPDELPPGFVIQSRAGADDSISSLTSAASGLHKLLLYTALGLLFVETFLAWQFGRHSR